MKHLMMAQLFLSRKSCSGKVVQMLSKCHACQCHANSVSSVRRSITSGGSLFTHQNVLGSAFSFRAMEIGVGFVRSMQAYGNHMLYIICCIYMYNGDKSKKETSSQYHLWTGSMFLLLSLGISCTHEKSEPFQDRRPLRSSVKM